MNLNRLYYKAVSGALIVKGKLMQMEKSPRALLIELCVGKLTGQTKVAFKHYYSGNFIAA